MEKIEKRPYELSIWEDYINENGEHDERKIAIFGSHLMKSKSRALSPKLVRKVNGEITFSFDMMYRYWDEDEMCEVVNPLIKYLINERKIKLKYKNKWYDLVIKQVDENPEKNTFSYTAKSLWTNELGRQGYSLSFSEEESNNQGTLKKLTEAALKDSDWLFDEENSYKPPQLKECPIYKVTLSMLQATAYKMLDNNTEEEIKKGNITIFLNYNEGEITEESDLKGRQFILPIDDKIEYDDNMFIKGDIYIFDKKQEVNFGFENSELVIGGRGKFVVSQPLSHYDKLLDRYVYEYKDSEGNDVYGYANTNYTETAATKELITNGSSIANSTGWFVWRDDLREKLGELDLKIREETKEDGEKKRIGYLEKKLSQFDDSNNGKYAYVANSGLWDNFSIFKEAKVNEEYIIAFPSVSNMGGIEVSVKWYPADSGKSSVELFNTEEGIDRGYYKNNDIEYYYSKVRCKCSMSTAELYTGKIYFLIQEYEVEKGQTDRKIAIEGMSFFKYIYNSEANNITDHDFILPNEIIYSSVQVENLYFKPSENYKTIEEIQHLDSKATYELQYPSDYQMIRDIKIQESNRFNIIQTLAETFEVWPEFIINHDDQGYILKDEDGRQQKYLRFNQYTGRRNYAGFRYGVNLKKIERKVESDTITSKIFVKQNSNKFAPNGNCRISEAVDNVIKEDFLFNFEYFLNQGLLDRVDFTNDLYSTEGKYLGYYDNLIKINKDKEKLHNRISQNKVLLTQEEASLEHIQLELTGLTDMKGECATRVENGENNIHTYVGSNVDWVNGTKFDVSDEIVKNIRQWLLYDQQEKIYKEDLIKVQANIDGLNKQLEADYTHQDSIKEEAQKLHKEFHNKYSNFIQEGSWVSEDYTDPNLYFLDAANVLATSATPKITYSIEAIAIDQIPEWKNYSFDIGDITFMEDEKFFGYIIDSLGIKVPKKEEIIISEITEELEEQSKDKIVAQNFKTQFEDLFQRITATVETLQFKEGEYNRSAGAITAQGKINKSVLDNTLSSNTTTIQNAQDGSVKWSSEGIIIKNENSPNEISKFVGKGLLVSTDGGATWTTGFSPSGINAEFIRGNINIAKANINSNQPGFTWDSLGINSYEAETFINGEISNYNYSNFVRMDQYGVYSFIKGQERTYTIKATQDYADYLNGETEKSFLKDVTATGSGNYIHHHVKNLLWHTMSISVDLTDKHSLVVINGDNGIGEVRFSFEIDRDYLDWDFDNLLPNLPNYIFPRLCYTGKDSNGKMVWKDIYKFGYSPSNLISCETKFEYYISDNKIFVTFRKKVPNYYNKDMWLSKEKIKNIYVSEKSDSLVKLEEELYSERENLHFHLQIDRFKHPKDSNYNTNTELFRFKLFGLPSNILTDSTLSMIYSEPLNGPYTPLSDGIQGIRIGDFNVNRSEDFIQFSPQSLDEVKNKASISLSKLGFFANNLSDTCFFSLEPTIGKGYFYGDIVATSFNPVDGTLYATSGYSLVSDVNKKENISLVSEKYNSFFDNISPVLFQYKDGNSGRIHTGFIAQEIEKALESSELTSKDFGGLVIKESLDGMGNVVKDYYLRYEEFISLNTWQIQKLKSRISELESEVQKLKENLT